MEDNKTEINEAENKLFEKGIQKSDATLQFLKTFILILTIIGVIGCIVVGIVFGTIGLDFLGVGIVFGGPLLMLLGYRIATAVLWVWFDLKLIRNKLYGISLSEKLNSFIGLDEAPSQESAKVENTENTTEKQPEESNAEEKSTTVV